MVIPDIIISWPDNADYPLWRRFLIKNRRQFNEVIIVFTKSNRGPDMTEFIRRTLSPHHCQFVVPPETRAHEDWRHMAIQQALLHSYNAEWIWFTEQDFIIPDWERFATIVDSAEAFGMDVMAYYDGPRMHPACILIRRSILEKTSRQFGIIPNKADHFFILQSELEAMNARIYRIDKNTGHLGFGPATCYHMAGVTHNMNLIYDGKNPCYDNTRFNAWLKEALDDPIEKDPRWVETFKNYLSTTI